MNFKKIVKSLAPFICAAVMAVPLSGCVSDSEFESLKERVAALEEMYGSDDPSGSGSSRENSSSRATAKPENDKDKNSNSDKNDSSSNEEFDPETVGDDINVEEYDYIDNGGEKYAFFTFENNSKFDVDADVEIECRDIDGKVLDTEDKTLLGLTSGNRSYAAFKLEPNTETIVRTVNYTENRGGGPSLDDIRARASRAQGGANITVANNGSESADDLKYLTLFFSGEKLAGFDSNDVATIGPGENATFPSEFYGEFDRVDIYIAIND